jgi:quercetin dioxygenase-like cupin family protein
MRLFPASGSTKGPADLFTGDVYFDVILQGEAPSRVRMNAVHFTPGARSAWHAHAVGQYLHITEGFAFMQERGSAIHVLRPGDTVYTPAGVWHWHGAAKGHFMTHLAV